MPGVGAAQLLGNLRVTLGEALDVRLVDDRPVPGCVRAAVVAPVEERVDDDALANERRAVEIVLRAAPGRRSDTGKIASFQSHTPSIALAYGSSSSLVGLHQCPLLGRPRDRGRGSRSAAPAGRPAVAVPAERRHLRQIDARLLAVVVEQAQLDALGDLREDREVGADAVERRTQRIGLPWPDLHARSDSSERTSRAESR